MHLHILDFAFLTAEACKRLDTRRTVAAVVVPHRVDGTFLACRNDPIKFLAIRAIFI